MTDPELKRCDMARLVVGITVERQWVQIEAGGTGFQPVCETDPTCCTDVDNEPCCGAAAATTDLTFTADGPLLANCGACELSGTLVKAADQMSWELNQATLTGCGDSVPFDLVMYCDNGVWHARGYVTPDAGAGDTIVFDVPLTCDSGTGSLVGDVAIPQCPVSGNLVIAIESPCLSYECVDGTCADVCSGDGTYASLVACQNACEAVTVPCCVDPIPKRLNLHVAGVGDFPFVWDPVNSIWTTGLVSFGDCGTCGISMSCAGTDAGGLQFGSIAGADCDFGFDVAYTRSCPPSFSVSTTATASGGGLCGCPGAAYVITASIPTPP